MSQKQFPSEMTVVFLDSYSGPEALRIDRCSVPRPGVDEVLVKVAASPINLSDIAFLAGRYGFKPPVPVIPGVEGSGTVVAVGPGMSESRPIDL
jgi:NADPH:quinone reductase-like Zn-dependent oxidoreductase